MSAYPIAWQLRMDHAAFAETVAINPVTGDMTLLDKFGYLYIAKPAVDQAVSTEQLWPYVAYRCSLTDKTPPHV